MKKIFLYFLYILLFVFTYIHNKVIHVKHLEIGEKLKNDLREHWHKITENKSSFININTEKKIISFKGSASEIKEFKNLLNALDQPYKNVNLSVQLGILEKDKSYLQGFTYFGIYNKLQSVKNQNKNFSFAGLGATLKDFPTPTSSVLGVPLINQSPNITLNQTSSTPNSFLPFTLGGANLNISRLSPQIFLNEQNTVLKNISNTEILVGDRESAKLSIGTDLPLYTTILEDSNGKKKYLFTVQYKLEGTFLQVKPIIDKNAQGITLEIFIEFTTKISGGTVVEVEGVNSDPPVFDIFRAFHKVYLKKNEAFLLSGFMNREKKLVLRKVPILYKIPVLGKLFQEKDISKIVEEGFLIITPKIV